MSKRPSAKKPKPMNAFYAQSGGVIGGHQRIGRGRHRSGDEDEAHQQGVRRPPRHRRRAHRRPHRRAARNPARTIKGLRYTPAGAFGSARYKLKGLEQDRAKYERLIEVFKAHDIGYFFYNGGNDSMDTANKVSQIGDQLGLPGHLHRRAEDRRQRPAAHRLLRRASARWPSTSRCPRAKPRSTWPRWPRLRRRCSSWKSWAVTPAGSSRPPVSRGKGPDQAPHIILFPEIAFDKEAFLAQGEADACADVGYCVVVVSEGVHDADGKFLADAGTKDAFGHTQLGGVAPVVANLVREAHGYKYHWAVADYLQRASRHIASKVDVQQAYAHGQGGAWSSR